MHQSPSSWQDDKIRLNESRECRVNFGRYVCLKGGGDERSSNRYINGGRSRRDINFGRCGYDVRFRAVYGRGDRINFSVESKRCTEDALDLSDC